MKQVGSADGHSSRRIDLAYVKLASSEMARDINRDIILELIRSNQPVGRAELARLSGLQPSTVSAIAEQLLKEGWITEGAAAKRPRGRRPTMLTLNSDLVILVADLRPGQAILAVVDLNGRFLSRESVPLASDAERATLKIAEAMESMRKQHPDKTFEGVGISVPGRVNPETQLIILAPNLHWADFDVKGLLTERLGLQVELENAANACLLSELWFGRMDGVRNAVLITVSEGVGSAILANGQILAGRSGLAGEFGHIPIDPNGPMCGCGQRGCWETFASSKAAVRYYADLKPEHPATRIQELLKLAEEGDPKALQALERQARALGRGLRLVTAALSPEVVLVIGDLTSSWTRIAPLVEEEMAATMLAGKPPRLAAASDGELARLRGAAALVLQRHSGYYRSTHATRASRQEA
ncbi:MAG TPA: ROK family protein [Acidobacteriaceae bacterium]|nr:ROK family protein [Acidobacteriaceae bacterium]